MRKYSLVCLVAVCVSWNTVTQHASAININLVYPAGNLFSAAHDAAAKNAINAAAADLSAAITTNLAAVNTDTYVGTNASATVTMNWSYNYENPQIDGNMITIDTATIAANTVTLYVGARNILGSTLGEGGSAAMGVGQNFSWGTASHLVGASASAQALSQAAYKRGGGPVIGNLSGSSNVGGQTLNLSVDYGVAYGALSLDWDGNNDNVKDSDAQLNNYWHFNHTTAVAASKNDLYSVALHEMIHTLGIGRSESWLDRISGTNWSGPEVIALHGTGTGVVNASQNHIASGIMSTRISDGQPQEVVMDPSITTGTRKSLTALDLAFLRDIGYSTIIPSSNFSPADFDQDEDVDSADLLVWRNSYGVNLNGDTDDDGDVDGRDFLFIQREFTGSLPMIDTATIPEPNGFVLLAGCLIVFAGNRRV